MLIVATNFSQAQALKVTAGNTLIGTTNGALIGFSVMGLTKDPDFTPVRIGVGAGTIFGLGVGVYDVSKMDDFGFYQVEGLFNSTDYTGLIILYDTFYGGVTGSVLGMAVSLMSNDPIIDGIRIGGSLGIMGGFLFGLVDAFYFSDSTGTFASASTTNSNVAGLVQLSGNNFSVGLLHPTVYSAQNYDRNIGATINTFELGLQVADFRIRF